MKIIISIPSSPYHDLKNHLLPPQQDNEESAFVFAEVVKTEDELLFKFRDWYRVQPGDYEFQSAYHFELSQNTRASIIKRAHDLGTSLIEFHSHLDQESARFSFSDWDGFSEFVPHIFWRLKNKPYSAIVFTQNNFDAVVWIDSPKNPKPLTGLRVDDHILTPTNNSMKAFFDINES